MREGRLNVEEEQLVSKIQNFEAKEKLLETQFQSYQYHEKEEIRKEKMANTFGTDEVKLFCFENDYWKGSF